MRKRGRLGLLVLLIAAAASFSLPAVVAAQDAPPWEGHLIDNILGENFVRENKPYHLGQLGLKKGETVTREKVDRAEKELFKTGKFNDVILRVEPVPGADRRVTVVVRVQEYLKIESVAFQGLNEIPLTTLKPTLRLAAGEALNPYHLKLDREYIRDQYLQKGYAFSTVQDVQKPGGAGGVHLTWAIFEGPMVSVDDIRFSGTLTVGEGDLRRFMLTKENDRLLFIPTGKNPFVERNLKEDVERIKLYYYLEGWLDIRTGDNVFLKDLEYNEDRSRVTVTIHVEEGRRYSIRNVRFDFDAASRRIFSEEEMRSWLVSKPGEPYTENNATADVKRIKDKYGERAFIQAEIGHAEIVSKDKRELDLVLSIKENDKVYVGRILFEGNTKTREEVLRREFTRTGFLPGEEYNQRSLSRATNRLRDRGFVDPQGGLAVRTQETEEPQTRDVLIDIKEGQTGTVRFAAGYSSSYGILGLLEFTQKNFDISDMPSSFSDLVDGTGFAGGGQFLRIRLAPAAERRTYSADFREPYFFGHEFGFGVKGYYINTFRESYDDERLGTVLTFDKRLDPFLTQIAFKAERITIAEVEADAPLQVKDIEGENRLISITPAIGYDTRDSTIFPSEGFRALVSLEYAGQVLPGTFDFNKLTLEMEGHVTLYQTESNLKHVGSVSVLFGWVHGARGVKEVPLIERFYAGGRDGPRGFDFRGMGPHEGDDPVGGEALFIGTVEYSYPLFVEFLRGAFFYDIANLTPDIYDLANVKWRNVVGFGLRFIIPQLGNIPVKLDFGFPQTIRDEDERQTVTFDIGALF